MLADLLLQTAVDLVAARAQRHLVLVLEVVVAVEARHLAQRRVALHRHEVVVALKLLLHSVAVSVHLTAGRLRAGLHVDVETSLVGVLDAPHQHQANHDGVAAAVVHLDGRHIHVTGAERELALHVERVGPEETVVGHRAAVAAEEGQHTALVGLYHHETRQMEAPQHPEQTAEDAGKRQFLGTAEDAQPDGCHHQGQIKYQMQEPIVRRIHFFYHFFTFHIIYF